MSTNYIAKCTHCDYSIDYKPRYYNYRYPGMKTFASFPQISNAWCTECKKFVAVQEGIDIKKIQTKTDSLYHELLSLEKNIFKTNNCKKQILSVKENLNDSIILQALIDNKSSHSTCIECGGNNLVYKNIESEIWLCPKCKLGHFVLEKEDDDAIYRLSEKIIYPQLNNKDEIDNRCLFLTKITLCSIDIMNNENVYYRLSKNIQAIHNLSNNYIILDRISLVYSILVELQNIPIDKTDFISDIIDYLIYSEIISEDQQDLVAKRINERIKFFLTEIKTEKHCSEFIPFNIIYSIQNPQNPITHGFTDIDLIDTLGHWKIITDTVRAYFYNFSI